MVCLVHVFMCPKSERGTGKKRKEEDTNFLACQTHVHASYTPCHICNHLKDESHLYPKLDGFFRVNI